MVERLLMKLTRTWLRSGRLMAIKMVMALSEADSINALLTGRECLVAFLDLKSETDLSFCLTLGACLTTDLTITIPRCHSYTDAG